jgi:hypothetical protein
MRSNVPTKPNQIIDNVMDLAQVVLAERPTLEDLLDEHNNEDFEIDFLAKEITFQLLPYDYTINIDGKRYVIVQFGDGEYEVYVNEELANKSHKAYPIFAERDYYVGCVFDNKDKASEFITEFCKLWKGVDAYLMMRERYLSKRDS